jgi:hypothetical protein
MTVRRGCLSLAAVLLLTFSSGSGFGQSQTAPMTPDIPAKFTPPHVGYD